MQMLMMMMQCMQQVSLILLLDEANIWKSYLAIQFVRQPKSQPNDEYIVFIFVYPTVQAIATVDEPCLGSTVGCLGKSYSCKACLYSELKAHYQEPSAENQVVAVSSNNQIFLSFAKNLMDLTGILAL